MIRIIAVGKVKEQYSKNAIDDYIERIKHYSKIEVIEVKESTIEKEANRINELVKDKKYYVLDLNGKQFTSEAFAQFVKRETFNNDLILIIGGSEGLSDNVKDKASDKISLSQMTFAHGMCRVFILEQIYRAFMILNNKRYHK
jgi:23S rRNA (pseudouridine1915-N3)-methyltransferase